jgi:hypothetical protein
MKQKKFIIRHKNISTWDLTPFVYKKNEPNGSGLITMLFLARDRQLSFDDHNLMAWLPYVVFCHKNSLLRPVTLNLHGPWPCPHLLEVNIA